jgi:hypothetical protein
VLDHVEEQFAHRLKEQNLKLLLERVSRCIRADPNAQAGLLAHPASQPPQARHQTMLVQDSRAHLVA